MSTVDLAGARWRLSSYSGDTGSEGGTCVEVAIMPACTAVRDSKDRGGPVLRYPGAAWEAFLSAVKGGQFD